MTTDPQTNAESTSLPAVSAASIPDGKLQFKNKPHSAKPAAQKKPVVKPVSAVVDDDAPIDVSKLVHDCEPGTVFNDRSIYLGMWAPVDENGKSLKKVFNVIAMPCDLLKPEKIFLGINLQLDERRPLEMTFDDFLERVKNEPRLVRFTNTWNDFSEKTLAIDNHVELIKKLKDNTYKREWILPPLELFTEHLMKFKNMFDPYAFQRDCYYHTITKGDTAGGNLTVAVNLHGETMQINKNVKARCRLIRLVPKG